VPSEEGNDTKRPVFPVMMMLPKENEIPVEKMISLLWYQNERSIFLFFYFIMLDYITYAFEAK
jgi:hypothetical protein